MPLTLGCAESFVIILVAGYSSDPFGDVGGAGMGFGFPSSVPAGKSQNPFDMF
jgi:hypothetical protein